jgi:hypothetical protein
LEANQFAIRLAPIVVAEQRDLKTVENLIAYIVRTNSSSAASPYYERNHTFHFPAQSYIRAKKPPANPQTDIRPKTTRPASELDVAAGLELPVVDVRWLVISLLTLEATEERSLLAEAMRPPMPPAVVLAAAVTVALAVDEAAAAVMSAAPVPDWTCCAACEIG